MIRNAELKRQVWTQINPTRLILPPVLFGLVMVLIFVEEEFPKYWTDTYLSAVVGFVLITMFFGAYQARGAVLRDIRQSTWDWMRLSAISPGNLAWGKLFGSTLYAWYMGGLLLIIMVVALYQANPGMPFSVYFFMVAGLIMAGLLSHGFALLLGLFMIGNHHHSKASSFAVIAVVFAGVSQLAILVGEGYEELSDRYFFYNGVDLVSKPPEWLITWYGRDFQMEPFVLLWGLVLCQWMFFGLQRAFKRLLQEPIRPVFWPLFLLLVCFLIGGFFWETEDSQQGVWITAFTPLMVSYFLCLGLAHYLVFVESHDLMVYRRMIQQWRTGRGQRTLSDIPAWVLTLLMAALFLNLMLLVKAVGHGLSMDGLTLGYYTLQGKNALMIALFFFALRDMMVMLFLGLHPANKYPIALATVYLLMAHGFFPWIADAADSNLAMAFLGPKESETGLPISLVSAILQTILVIAPLARFLWRDRDRPPASPDGPTVWKHDSTSAS
ncbi:MAG: hypothetical protein HQL53_09790 [Magnetococcales bacterium]|nr:hypothetical protein [Magnetococcales bacterium]